MSKDLTNSENNSDQSARILLVDDNTTNLQLLHETLDGQGYKLLIAKSGKTALAITQKAKPSLILLDIMMPEMDGYEVCRRLKADESTRQIPVIFITALVDEEDEAKGLGLGAVDYITKPINPELVRARVHNHLELKRHQDHRPLPLKVWQPWLNIEIPRPAGISNGPRIMSRCWPKN